MPEPNRKWLIQYVKLQLTADRRVEQALNDALDELEASLSKLEAKPGVGAKVRASQLVASRGVIAKVLDRLFGSVGKIIREEQSSAARLAEDLLIKEERGIWGIVEPSKIKQAGSQEALRVQAARQIQATMANVLGDRYDLSERIYKSKAMSKNQILRTVNRHIAIGSSADDIAKDIKQFVNPKAPGGASYRAKLLSRTEINNAFHAQSIADAQERPWIRQVNWNLSKSHEREGCVCEKYAMQKLFPVDNVPRKPHPQCFSGEAMVSTQSLRSVSKRWYDGRFVDVFTTEDTPQLSGTPNHPALTRRGWVPLSELRNGDELVVYRGSMRPMLDLPGNQGVVSRVEDVFESFRMTSGMSSSSMPQSPEQFHGDGMLGNEYVDIVGADVPLEFGVELDRLLDEELSFRNADLPSKSSFRGFAFGGERHRGSAGSVVSSSRHGFRVRESGSLLSASHAELLLPEHVSNSAGFEADDLGRLFESLSGSIDFHRVTGVFDRVGGFRGHVYNLHTDEGWYIANSVPVHNCLCSITPELPDLDTALKDFLSGQYSPWLPSSGTL